MTIRTALQPGDLGAVIALHGRVYGAEYGYGIEFEAYVAEGLAEFYRQYDAALDRVWVCEEGGELAGFLLLMHRGVDTAQLRYFILSPAHRGAGLGKRLMEAFMSFLQERGYRHAYLWTTHELPAAASLYKRHGFVLVEEKWSTGFGKPLFEHKYEWHAQL